MAAERCYDPTDQAPFPCTKASPATNTNIAVDPAWRKAITAPTQVQHQDYTCIFIEPVRHSACQQSNTRGPGPQHAQSKWWKVEDSLPNERMTVHILANTSITSGNTCCTHASIASVNMCTHARIASGGNICTHASIANGNICAHASIANFAGATVVGLSLPNNEVALSRLPSVRRNSGGSYDPILTRWPSRLQNKRDPIRNHCLANNKESAPEWRHVHECPNL